MDMNVSKLQETVEDRGAWHAAVHEGRSQTQLSDWTATSGVVFLDQALYSVLGQSGEWVLLFD